MDCSCAPILRFFSVTSDGATIERQIQNRVFWSISYQFEEDSVANYASIWTLFSLFSRVPDVLCNALNNLQFRRQVAPQESLICGGNIPKRRNSAAQLSEILRILTIYIVINSNHVLQQHMRVTISCRYALSSRGRCFCFQLFLYFVLFIIYFVLFLFITFYYFTWKAKRLSCRAGLSAWGRGVYFGVSH